MSDFEHDWEWQGCHDHGLAYAWICGLCRLEATTGTEAGDTACLYGLSGECPVKVVREVLES